MFIKTQNRLISKIAMCRIEIAISNIVQESSLITTITL